MMVMISKITAAARSTWTHSAMKAAYRGRSQTPKIQAEKNNNVSTSSGSIVFTADQFGTVANPDDTEECAWVG